MPPSFFGALGKPLEIERKETCIIWNCGKPLRGEDGKPKGSRGMCWQHLKQSQRAGNFVPFKDLERIYPPCRKCGKPVKKYTKQRLCAGHYEKHRRQVSPSREERLARDRARKARRSPEQVEREREMRRRRRARARAKLAKQLAKEAA